MKITKCKNCPFFIITPPMRLLGKCDYWLYRGKIRHKLFGWCDNEDVILACIKKLREPRRDEYETLTTY